MSTEHSTRPRPLSPHLQIYRLTITMAMSIGHRLTGAALYFGALLVTWWLIALASGPYSYAIFQVFLGSWPGQITLLGFIWALIHHMLGGIRHLLWDSGLWIDPPAARKLAWATLVGSVGLTLVVWLLSFSTASIQ